MVESGPEAWTFWIPDDLTAIERFIVGFEMRVESLESKFKLSQNRSAADRAGILRGLASRNDEGSRGVLALMNNWEKAHG